MVFGTHRTAHYPIALKAGLPQAVADDLKVGKRPASMQPNEAAVYDLCMDLAKDHVVSDATFKKAREIRDPECRNVG